MPRGIFRLGILSERATATRVKNYSAGGIVGVAVTTYGGFTNVVSLRYLPYGRVPTDKLSGRHLPLA